MILEVNFTQSPPLEVKFVNTDYMLGVNFGAEGGTFPYAKYAGAYTVDPQFTPIYLPTKGTYLDDDVTVNEIAVARVSNPAGGITVTIGGLNG